MVKKLALVAVIAFAGVLAVPAHASPIVTGQLYGTSPAPFTLENLGSTGASGYIGATSTNAPTGGLSFAVTVPGASQTPGTYPSGVYAGTTTNVAATPYYTGLSEYLVAQPGGTITVTYETPQTTIDLLWGSIDASGVVDNTLSITVDGFTLTGAEIAADTGLTIVNGVTSAYIEISGLSPATTSYTISDTGTGSAFEIDPGVPVSEAGTLGMLGAGLIGLIALGGFRRRSLVGC